MAFAPDEDKRRIGAPCVFYEIDEKKEKMSVCYPTVNCNHQCEHCGWNPKEREFRMREGKLVNKSFRLSSVDGKIINLPSGVKTLSFRYPDVVN